MGIGLEELRRVGLHCQSIMQAELKQAVYASNWKFYWVQDAIIIHYSN